MMTLDFLEKVDAFRELTDEQLTAIGNKSELVEFKKGDRIFAHGADATDLWITVDGDVQLCSEVTGCEIGGKQVSFLSAAHAFGWTCFVPPYKYQLSGYCASRRCRVIRLSKDDLDNLFADYPEIGFALMQYTMSAVGTQFQELQDELAQQRGQEVMSKW